VIGYFSLGSEPTSVFGTVVTGTLIDGSLHVADEIVALPEGLKVRIRGLQSHNVRVEAGLPGSRLAVNLSGIGTEQLKRGDVITHPGCFSSTFMSDARLQVLHNTPAPPGVLRLLILNYLKMRAKGCGMRIKCRFFFMPFE
jgi:selenocysteine-specific translation elongation factor